MVEQLIRLIVHSRSLLRPPRSSKFLDRSIFCLDHSYAEGQLIRISLFDSHAVKIHNQLETMRGDPRVVVATSVDPKMVGYTRLTPAALLLMGYAKVESLSIAELNDFVITAPSQEIDFICTGRVTEVKMKKGWCYISFSNCAKKLQRTVSSFTCLPCNKTNAVGVLRYRVEEMSVADETSEALFVCFDGVMTKLHNMKAYEAGHLLAGDGVNPEETQTPSFVADMVANHQTFTVSLIEDEHESEPHSLHSLITAETMTMEMTNPVPSQCLLRWKLVVEAGGSIKAHGASDKVKKASKT
uniref:Replication factor A C-terminal domain-containing protein n=2 Tax=Brassica oleracea TaxID=3712 RepID=A0A0D3DLE6_BRAOL|nr:unnamed protein product [Brassica oleracea]